MFDVSEIIQAGGLLLILLIIFAESGMFVGFFLPGDTLLVSAGVFAAQGKLDIAVIIPLIALAAIIGDNIGYYIGKKYGRRLFNKPDSIIFNKDHLHQAERFFKRFGPEAMLLAHFVPVVRTFAPPVAGTSNMPYKKFFIYDAIGDIAWAASLTLVGYYFGSKIPDIDHYIKYVILAVILATIIPTAYHFIKAKRERRKAKKDTEEIDNDKKLDLS